MFKFLKMFVKEAEDPRTSLQNKFASFRELLESNNQALAIMADMEEKASEDFLFDRGYLQQQVEHLREHISRLVSNLNQLSRDRYRDLVAVFARIQEEIDRYLVQAAAIPETPFILPLHALNHDKLPGVGSKMANLGEIRNRLGLAVPRGFAITAAAYKAFMEETGLVEAIAAQLHAADLADLESLQKISQDIQDLVLKAPLPEDLEQILRLAAQALPTDRLAVRSSAVGEDTEYSFAGQFATLLNVPVADLPTYYQRIIASKFTPQALFYWKYHNFSVHELPMAVGVLAMVPAKASGVMFSLDPHDPASGQVIINAVWGLGKFAVDGAITPDLYVVDRGRPLRLRQAIIADKTKALRCRAGGGCAEVDLPASQARTACLTEGQAQSLAEIALALENHFGSPQDIEWAVDDHDNLVLLQSRPLRISASENLPDRPDVREPVPEPTVAPLLQHGVRAVGGVAAGPVYGLLHDRDLDKVPDGAVVLTRQPSPRLVLIMDRINAIITEAGSPTDHMTILAREFRIPTLVGVEGAAQTLQHGQLVTVDADAARIFPGIVNELLRHRESEPEPWRDNGDFLKLRQILKKTVPLHLLDPEAPEFQAQNCRTLHDITRFCHEKAMDAMFTLDVEAAATARGVCRLKTSLPMNLFVLDLGGGLETAGSPEIEADQVLSLPFKALLQGFHHPEVSWAGAVAPDLKGFISVFANTMYDANKADRGLGGKTFAIISKNYLNFNSRLGYHFGLVDAYLCEEINDNYISFQFKGGAASVDRRERRVRLLNRLLEDLGFQLQNRGDLVQGRMAKFSFRETEQALEQVALLLAFCRQLDLALASEAVMERCLQAFRSKDYGLACLRSA